MIPADDLKDIALERLADAQTLLIAGRFDSSFYLCGYSVEIALKYKICKTLNWAGFPSSSKEFEKLKSLRTHDLELLLSLTGFESEFKIRYFDEWSLVSNWTPESRYHVTGLVSEAKAKNMFAFTSIILQSL
ncbi:HEPN domain-containing protein [Dyadobacter sp. CY343]|uniref:HEPN domain-containing protein n=1 Tax=Dyadobacter sp. CY343 TaxID=2907299 RepID=UPI001F287246|nr:HEPN domain-containing protein [Dyadobacter sp. CY343]MCE7058774.1 HEPN domain-containing protein [Dyadobacter sp. CY343]